MWLSSKFYEGKRLEESLVYSSLKIRCDEVIREGVANVISRLEGKLASVNVASASTGD